MKKLFALLFLFPAVVFGQNYPSPTYNVLTLQTPLAVLNGGTGVTTATGTGSVVKASSPTIASPTFTGIVTLPQTTQAATGFFFTSAGGRLNRANDRLFLGTATQYDGNQTPSTGDWSKTMFPVTGGQGAYEYLVSNAAEAVGAPFGQLAGTFYARTSDGTGGGTQATIGASAFVVNDNLTGAGANSWAYYGTTVRTATSTGFNTDAMELDVANLGATVRQYPNNLFVSGLTNGIAIMAGGELQNDSGVTMGTGSAALVIGRNDVTAHANWDKGIIFHSTGIAGVDGTGAGTGTAIAMSPGHIIQYFNNSNAVTGGFYSSATTVGGTLSQEQYVQLSNFGTLFTDGNALTQFRVNNATTSAADYIQVDAANAGASPTLSAQGTDTNINLTLQGKGIGAVILPQNDVLTYTSVGGQSIPNNATTTMTGWTKTFDRINSNFNASTGVYTAPATGYYHVDAGINYSSNGPTAANEDYQVAVIANGTAICVGAVSSQVATTSVVHSATTGCDVSLSAGQTVTLQAFQNSGAAVTLATGAGVNYVSIHKIP